MKQFLGFYILFVIECCTSTYIAGGPPARPQIKEEDIKQLQEMFPTVDKEVIQSVLEASNGQVDPAVTNLLQMTQ